MKNSKKDMTKKIIFLALCSLLLAPCCAADAQQSGKIFRIGILDPSTASGSAVLVKAFLLELGKLGWSEGKNFTIEYRFGENKGPGHRLELAAELVRLKVDLIVATSGPSASAGKTATTTIPIVMMNAGDPVGEGLVASLARRGVTLPGCLLYPPS